MEKVWVVASGKGGTGKSTLVANLGAALAVEGHRVLLVDLNVGLRCLDLCLGLDDRVLFDVMDVLEGSCRSRDAILAHPTLASLFLMPAAQNRSTGNFDGQRLQALCGSLAKDFDMIILDCPPGLEPIPARAAIAAWRGMIVTTADPAAIRDADRMAAEFSAAGVLETYLVVNRFRTDFLHKQMVASAQEIAASLGLPLFGTIPEDEAVGAATLCGVPVVIRQKDSPAARIFTAMARRMPGKELL
jgi:septum site-determining protein MinD